MLTYCIHLEERKDRLPLMKEAFEMNGLNPIIFPAVKDKPGWKGCLASHLAVLKKIYESKENVALVLEDDAKFLYAPILPMVRDIMEQLPEDWDMLYLGCSPQEPFERYSENLYWMGKNYTTHAILWNNRAGGLINYILSRKWNIKYDLLLSEYVHPMFDCFAASPLLVTQHQTASNCCTRSDLLTIQKNFNKYCV